MQVLEEGRSHRRQVLGDLDLIHVGPLFDPLLVDLVLAQKSLALRFGEVPEVASIEDFCFQTLREATLPSSEIDGDAQSSEEVEPRGLSSDEHGFKSGGSVGQFVGMEPNGNQNMRVVEEKSKLLLGFNVKSSNWGHFLQLNHVAESIYIGVNQGFDWQERIQDVLLGLFENGYVVFTGRNNLESDSLCGEQSLVVASHQGRIVYVQLELEEMSDEALQQSFFIA
jgi:hypothetical protein